MRYTSLVCRLVVAVGALGGSQFTRASVVLTLSPSLQQVQRGGTVTVTVSLTSTSEHTVGVNYFLRSPTAGAFTIATRSITGSPYSDVTNVDSTVLASNSATLNQTRASGATFVNGADLGATAATEQANGTFPVATYTLKVNYAVTNGTYTLLTYSDPGNGYSGGASTNYAAADFTSQGSATINVVPEPATLAGVALAGVTLLRRRRVA